MWEGGIKLLAAHPKALLWMGSVKRGQGPRFLFLQWTILRHAFSRAGPSRMRVRSQSIDARASKG